MADLCIVRLRQMPMKAELSVARINANSERSGSHGGFQPQSNVKEDAKADKKRKKVRCETHLPYTVGAEKGECSPWVT